MTYGQMSYEQIAAMMEEMELPFAYHHFAEGECPQPPFLVFLSTGERTFLPIMRCILVLSSWILNYIPTGNNQKPNGKWKPSYGDITFFIRNQNNGLTVNNSMKYFMKWRFNRWLWRKIRSNLV